MMIEVRRDYHRALDMLLLESNSLKDLAQVSGRDPFGFYQGADLSNLDLSGQDLTGLNFDFADLSGSRLDNIDLDIGALNKSVIDSQYHELTDPYDLSMDDLSIPEVGALSLNFRMRPDTLESLVSSRGMYIRDFAIASNLTAASFWRIRNSYFVTFSTIRKLLDFILRERNMFIHSNEEEHLLRQPCLQAKMADGVQIEAKRVLAAADYLRRSWRLRPEPLHNEHNSRKIHVPIIEMSEIDFWPSRGIDTGSRS
jgi:hypothetical protein